MGSTDGDIPVDDIRREDPLPIQRESLAVGLRHDLRQGPHRLDRPSVVFRLQVVDQGAGEVRDGLPVLGPESLWDV